MKIKKFTKTIVLVAILTLASGSFCYADTFTGGRSSAVYKAYFDSSVSSYGYSPHYMAGMSNWNNISSKVSLSITTSTSDYPDKYYIGNTATNGLWGQTAIYKKNLLGQIVTAQTTDTWVYSTIVLYDNQMKAYNMNAAEVKSTATHEVGHTLSLAHTTASVESVMREGAIQFIGPTTYDITQLKAKWGN
ncbi:hypothetical protein [Clostridium aminobutyricum]|uniref:Peptidase M10 metallopeptidase domain-containing protein n=1 Tax=Clostridium aminobutyricum TaxID=33953 RepID=A0A939IKB2_CLOAM|nr:hypothetical protein [Clostridium aminobutyricum]MBN7774463.1 hypothetical protein [Clostridium aminobutyricum]